MSCDCCDFDPCRPPSPRLPNRLIPSAIPDMSNDSDCIGGGSCGGCPTGYELWDGGFEHVRNEFPTAEVCWWLSRNASGWGWLFGECLRYPVVDANAAMCNTEIRRISGTWTLIFRTNNATFWQGVKTGIMPTGTYTQTHGCRTIPEIDIEEVVS